MAKKYLKICPKCGSKNIKNTWEGVKGITPEEDVCQDCGNRGLFPEVEEKSIEKFKKILKES